VFLDDGQALDAVEALVDSSCVILCGKNWDVYGSSLSKFTDRSMMGFVDGRVSRRLLEMSNKMKLESILSTRSARRRFQGWHGNSC
jgi:hypothetical protein